MSVNLTLILDRSWAYLPVFSGYNRLALRGKWYDLWDAIKALHGHGLDDELFEWYSGDGVEHLKEDCYGQPLRWVFAKHLATLELPPEMDGWDAAVFAFIRAVPPDTRILLYWW